MTSLINILASIKTALVILLLIAIACIAGTVLPQGGEVIKYLEANPSAQARMEVFGFLGLTNIFYCWWFVLLLCLLAISLSICTFRRFRGALKRPCGLRWKDIGSLLTHFSLLLILAGSVVRSLWGQNGYLPLREGETKGSFRTKSEIVELPFDVYLEDFEIDFYEDTEEELHTAPSQELLVLDSDGHVLAQMSAEEGIEKSVGSVDIRILRMISDCVVSIETGEVTSRSDEMRNPALQLQVSDGTQTNTQWVFALYPDFNMHSRDGAGVTDYRYRYNVYIKHKAEPSVKDYKSTLVLIDQGVEVAKKTIEVNLPLSYKGYTFYQSGFDPDDPKWTSLQVVKDPGVPLVYAGFMMMIIGLAMVFYVDPNLSINVRSNAN